MAAFQDQLRSSPVARVASVSKRHGSSVNAGLPWCWAPATKRKLNSRRELCVLKGWKPKACSLVSQTQTIGAGARSGYHTYGVDVEPTTTTFYYDRHQYYQVPTIPASQRPLFVMMQLALGGGNYNNSTVTGYDWTLTPKRSQANFTYYARRALARHPDALSD